MQLSEKMISINHKEHICEEYVKGLEKERDNIQVFRRELPLCLQLVTQAIEACKQQLRCSTSEVHFDEESESGEQFGSNKSDGCNNNNINIIRNDKSDWLKSAQLWNNQYPAVSLTKEKEDSQSSSAWLAEVNGSGDSTSSGVFHPPLKIKDNNRAKLAPKTVKSVTINVVVAAATHDEKYNSSKKEIKLEEESKKGIKTRRSWSHDLHQRFLHALQLLGGSHAATPKQTREIMKEDGLTNDEVKSHLQGNEFVVKVDDDHHAIFLNWRVLLIQGFVLATKGDTSLGDAPSEADMAVGTSSLAQEGGTSRSQK